MTKTTIQSLSSSRFENVFPKGSFGDPTKFQTYLMSLMNAKNLTGPEVWHNAFGPEGKVVWHNYYSGKVLPTKENVRRLVFGLHCSVEEAKHLLAICGYSFVPDDVTDEYLLDCLEGKEFNMVKVSAGLYQLVNDSRKLIA